MNRQRAWIVLGFGATLAVFVWGSVQFAALTKFADDHSGLAAWAQAILSVAAIWFSAGLGRRDRREDAKNMMSGFQGIMSGASELASKFVASVGDDGKTQADDWKPRFDAVQELLANIPAVELGSNSSPLVIIETRERLRQLSELARLAANNGISLEGKAKAERLRDAISHDLDRVNGWLKWRSAHAKSALFW